MDETVVIL